MRAQPYEGSFGTLPGQAAPETPSCPFAFSAAAPHASKRRLHPHRPGSSLQHILSLINSFEAFRIRYLRAPSAPSPAPPFPRQGHLPAGNRMSLYYYLFPIRSRRAAGRERSSARAADTAGAHASTQAAPRLHPGPPRPANPVPTAAPQPWGGGVPGGAPTHRLPHQRAAGRARCQTRRVPAIKSPLRAADDT